MSTQGLQSIRKAYRPTLVVLVIEDHLMFSKEIKHALPEHTVVFARSVEDAKARYDECLPNITFLDIDLPDGNGFELLDYIRAREPEAHVVILTGSKFEEDVLISRQKGAHGYIIKPFTKSKIEQSVEEYLQNREAAIQLLLSETEKRRYDAITGSAQEGGN
jgi:CheY-like chemotaxis protein